MYCNRFVAAALALSFLSIDSIPSFAACNLAKVAELPVTMSDMRPLVTAKINGADVQFMADSGAFYSMISAASAAEHNLVLDPAPRGLRHINGIGGATEIAVANVAVFTLANIPLHNIRFLVGGSEAGEGSVGLLGQNVFHIGDVEYDLANGVIRLMHTDGCKNAMLAYWAKSGEPYSVLDISLTTPLLPHTMATAFVNGEKIRVMFDTGASSSVLSLKAAERAGVKPDSPGVIESGEALGLGRTSIKSYLAPFSSFKIGDEEIRNAQLRIEDLKLETGDMLIGVDFFLSHRIYVASSQHKLYFTYNGGPVFNLFHASSSATPQVAAESERGDASALSRRGMALAGRRDFVAALDDLNRAVELQPNNPDYLFERGVIRGQNQQADQALADFNHVLQLNPDHVPALVNRAELLARGQQFTGAAADLDEASRIVTKEADVRLQMGSIYESSELWERALVQYDLWIAAHGVDVRFAAALNSRCRVRAWQGQNLPAALRDCSHALRRSATGSALSAEALANRALVRLRQDDFDKSIADYDESLKLAPKSAGSLYGRGLAKLKKKRIAEGEADMAEALKMSPDIAAQYQKHGLVP